MKIRSGFVSNSSSSSFVLVFPDITPRQFIEKHESDILDWVTECEQFGFDWDKYESVESIDATEKERLLSSVESKLIDVYYGGELCQYDDDDGMYAMLSSISTREYELAGFDVSSDSGAIVILNRNELLKKLGVENV